MKTRVLGSFSCLGFAALLTGFAMVGVASGQVREAWVARYDPSGSDYARALAVDQAGNVYVTGGSQAGPPLFFFHYATVKYAPDGTQLWVRRYNGPDNLEDFALALAVDQAGNVIVTGHSSGTGTGLDYATVKYAPDGTQLWVQRYNGPDNLNDDPRALAVDQAGNVIVTGISYVGLTDTHYTTVKYAPDGTRVPSKSD